MEPPQKEKPVKAWLAPFKYFGLKRELYDLLENISCYLASGIPINETLESLYKESDHKRIKNIVGKINKDVSEGMSISDSLEKNFLFSESVIEIIRSGELSGNLPENLKLLILLNDEENKLRSKLNSSFLYGIIVVSLTIIIGIGTAWFVLPKITSVYSEIGADLPFLTILLIKLSNFMIAYGYIFVPTFISFLLIMLYFFFSFPKTKFIGHLLLFYMPFVKKIIIQSEITRFGFLLGKITEAGMPISKALEIMPGTTTFNNYRNLYIHLGKRVFEGAHLSEALKEYKKIKSLMPISVIQMISSAEKAGRLSKTFLRISELYGSRLESTSKNLPIIIEPILLIIVGLAVVTFALATLLPIYNLSEIIQ